MTIEKDAEDIIEKFSKTLENIPDSDESVRYRVFSYEKY